MIIILGLFLCFLISYGGSPIPPAPTPEIKKPTDDEKIFITASINYLTVARRTNDARFCLRDYTGMDNLQKTITIIDFDLK